MSYDECPRNRGRLREMTFGAIEPIVGLHRAIEEHHNEVRSQMGTR